MKFNILAILLLLQSCTMLPKRDRARDLQTDIIAKLSEKTPQIGNCARGAKLKDIFKTNRFRIELYLTLNSKGQIDRFKLDDKNYPNEFVECVFRVVDLIDFPKLKEGESIELTQPFIFSQK